MRGATLRPVSPTVKRTAPARSAAVGDEAELFEADVAAFREAVLSSSLADPSAVPAVADLLAITETTVYNQAEARVTLNEVTRFRRFVQACLRAKRNDHALAPVRYLCGLFLSPPPAHGVPALGHGVDLLHQAGEAIAAWSCLVDGCATPDEARAAIRELDDVIHAAGAARAMAEGLLGGGRF